MATEERIEAVTMRIVRHAKAEYERGVEAGKLQATSIYLGEFGYGSAQSAVTVLEAKSRRELSRMVKDLNWRREGDNPGQQYGHTCQLIRTVKTDEGRWLGICIASSLWDV